MYVAAVILQLLSIHKPSKSYTAHCLCLKPIAYVTSVINTSAGHTLKLYMDPFDADSRQDLCIAPQIVQSYSTTMENLVPTHQLKATWCCKTLMHCHCP